MRAFAKALLPPGHALPAADTDDGVAVADAVERLLGEAPSRTRGLARVALRVLELTPFPRRFSRLAPARATAVLAAMESSRLAPRRDVLLLLKTLACVAYVRDPRVQNAIGFEATCVCDEQAAARVDAAADALAAPLRADQLTAPDGVERCDVVVVGSGAGGASVARVLAERGVDVIVVEQGPYHDASSYSSDVLAALPALYREAGLTFCEGRPAIPLPVGRCVGGTTVINSGTCLRPPADVLRDWRDTHGIAWATELDGHFDAVDRALGVAPVDAERAGGNAARCRAGADALGWANGPLPRNAPGVTRCASCPTGCTLDAKRAMHVSELPRAVAAGARVRAGALVERVIVEADRAVGVACRGYEVRARAVVVAAGALGTPELLLAQGVANGSGELGRNLRIHPACWVGARFDEPVRGWEGVMQSWAVDAFHDRGLFLEATLTPPTFGAHWLRGVGEELQRRIADYDRLAVIGVHLSERSKGRVAVRGGKLRIRYSLRADDARTLRFGIARAAEIHVAAGAREVYPQLGRLGVLAPEQITRIERGRVPAAHLRLEAFHPMGTARMGSDRRRCVVSPSGEAYDLAGLYIADASIFPTSLRVNPMVTIMACARQIAGQLAEALA